MRRPWKLLMFALVLVPALGVSYLLTTPRLRSVLPAPEDGHVPASEPLRLAFSHRMQAESVLARLTIEPAVEGAFSWEGKDLIFTPQGGWPTGAVMQVSLAPGAQAASFPGLSIREESAWTFQVGYARLVYLFPSGAEAGLYRFDPQTGENLRLAERFSNVFDFSVSPDGRQLFFSAGNPQGGSSLYRLEISSPDGEDSPDAYPEPQPILDCGEADCRSPNLSPAGDYLAYERAGSLSGSEPVFQRVWLLPIEDNWKPGEPYLAGDPENQTLLPAWSSRGWLAFYDTTQSAYVFFEPRSGERRLVSNNIGLPGAWQPDGSAFVAPQGVPIRSADPDVSGRTAAINLSLALYSLDGGSEVALTNSREHEDSAPAFSPSGDSLAFSRKGLDMLRWTPGRQIWTLQAGASQPQPLTNDSLYDHYDLAWDPAGEQLAYVRFNQTTLTEPTEVWLVDVASTQARKLVVGGFSPQWIP